MFQALARLTIRPWQQARIGDYLQSTSKYTCLESF